MLISSTMVPLFCLPAAGRSLQQEDSRQSGDISPEQEDFLGHSSWQLPRVLEWHRISQHQDTG